MKIAASGEERDRERHRAEHHLLLVLALAPERLLALALTLGEPLLDPFDERVDERRLHVGVELLPRGDRRLQLVARDEVFAHSRLRRERRA